MMTLQSPAFFYHFTNRQLIWWREPTQFACNKGAGAMLLSLVAYIELERTGMNHVPSPN